VVCSPGPQTDEAIPFRLDSEVPHSRSLWIGVLEGTWSEIGQQYGKRCGKDIARNFELTWRNNVLNGSQLWQVGRSDAERADYAVKYLSRSLEELSHLSPEMTELFRGISEGARSELAAGKYATVCPDHVKIAFLNFSGTHFHPNWDFETDQPGPVEQYLAAQQEEHDCNGFWVSGKATSTGHTYATRTAQGRHIREGGSGRERQISYVAIPADPAAYVFWGNGRAGNLGGIGGGLMNERGVACLTAGASYSDQNWQQAALTAAPGVKDFWLASYGVIFSGSAREAAEVATLGTPEYREKTGRQTLLRVRGASIVFADPMEAIAVEQNARHYALREPGDLGEKDSSYLVIANHFKVSDGSYDETNTFRPEIPMESFEREGVESSYYRFWTGMWNLKSNFGKIDLEMVRDDFVTAHYAYDESGNRIEPDPRTGAPTVAGTFCDHDGPFTTENPMGVGGNTETSVFNLTTREVWWVPVWPCHYKQNNMSWSYTDLRPYSEYREMKFKSQ
jgi:hypothetical protein